MSTNEFALLNRPTETFGIRYPVFLAEMVYRTSFSFEWTYSALRRVISNREKWNLLCFMTDVRRSIDKTRMALKLSLDGGQGVAKIDRVMPASERFAGARGRAAGSLLGGARTSFEGVACSATMIARPPMSHEM